MIFFKEGKAAQPASGQHTDPVRIGGGDAVSGIRQRHVRSGNTESDKPFRSPGLLAAEKIIRMKVLDLGGNARLEAGCIELGDTGDTGFALAQGRPCLFNAGAQRCHKPESGDNDSACFGTIRHVFPEKPDQQISELGRHPNSEQLLLTSSGPPRNIHPL